MYTLKEVCEQLQEKEYNLKYIEKSIGPVLVDTDAQGNRLYTDENIEFFKNVLFCKAHGINVKTIKLALQENIIKFVQPKALEGNILIENNNELTERTKKEEDSIRLRELVSDIEIESINKEDSFFEGTGSIEEIMKLLVSGLSFELNKKIDSAISEIKEVQKESIYIHKQNIKMNEKLDMLLKENRKVGNEIIKKIENRDIDLTDNLLKKMELRKKLHEKEKSFFYKLFNGRRK